MRRAALGNEGRFRFWKSRSTLRKHGNKVRNVKKGISSPRPVLTFTSMSTIVSLAGACIVVLIFGFGCGPSNWGLHLRKLSEETKRTTNASAIQTQLTSFFANEQSLTNPLPKEITSLPIFSDDPTNIEVNYCGAGTNVLMLHIGGGFGHWGLLIAKPGHDSEISQWHRERIKPWDDGVYFFSEYRD